MGYLCGGQIQNCLAGFRVDRARAFVIQIVAEVRTDDDQRFAAAPQVVEHLGHRVRSGLADDDR